MKLSHILNTLIIAGALLTPTFTADATNPYSPLEAPTPGRITILAKTPFNSGKTSEITEARFKEAAECGFNAVSIADSDDCIARGFRAAAGSGLKIVICQGSKGMQEMSQLVNMYKDNPLLAGYEMRDEPKFSYLPELKDIYEKVRELDPKHMAYINLAVDFGTNEELKKKYIGETGSHNKYLKLIQKIFHPVVWSYDFYPIASRQGKTIVNVTDFFKYMQLFHDEAKTTGRPFWTYSMCMPYAYNCGDVTPAALTDGTANGRLVPTEGELRFEAFSSLAYGAQGIVYWAYTQRPPQGPLTGTTAKYSEYYLSAPIDIDGNKTEIWYSVRNVNNEIRAFNDVFYGCKVIDVVHTSKTYPGTKAYTPEFGYFKTLETGTEGVLVSHLHNKGKDYIMIVNHDPLHPQTIQIEFQNPRKITEMLPTGKRKPVTSKTRTLSPGGYILYRLK